MHSGSWSKVAIFALLVGSLLAISPELSQAATITSGACSATVDSSAGVSIYSSGGKCFIAFTSVDTHTWTVPSNIASASIFLVAGGGAGGAGAWGGGGGAGGIVFAANYALTPSTLYTVVVGRGGTVGAANLTPSSNRSNNGTNSWFGANTFAAIGGGAGASYSYGTTGSVNGVNYTDGAPGGSGGGATEANVNTVGGSATQTTPSGADSSFGNHGGKTLNGGGNMSGAGGGGAGAAGADNITSGVAGNGGAGATYSNLSVIDTIGAVTGYGQLVAGHYYFAGGGGGGSSGTGGSGGSGGGGAGGTPSTYIGQDATANTGGGGGGASYNSASYAAGAGASGIVVISYTSIVTTSITASLLSPSTGTYRTLNTITATLVGANTKVTFYENGRIIPGCKAVMSVGLISRCQWKPTTHGFVRLSIQAAATSGSTASSTTAQLVIGQRQNNR